MERSRKRETTCYEGSNGSFACEYEREQVGTSHITSISPGR